jgi:hypothetical protein
VQRQLQQQMQQMAQVQQEAPTAVRFTGKELDRLTAMKKAPVLRKQDAKSRAFQYQQRLEQAAEQVPVEAAAQVLQPQAPDASQMRALATGVNVLLPTGGQAARGWTGTTVAAGEAGALASLDVDLPAFDARRWTAYRFTTPRGEVAITARAFSWRLTETLERLLVAALAVALVAVVRRLRTGRPPNRGRRVAAARWLAVCGFIGLLAGVLPVYAALALAIGLGWLAVLALAKLFSRGRLHEHDCSADPPRRGGRVGRADGRTPSPG